MINRPLLQMNKLERKMATIAILVFLTTTFFFIFFHHHLFIYDENHFLIAHILLELASIVISFTIAMQSWIFFPYSRLNSDINIFVAFFSIAFLDLFHMMTYKGMPGLLFVESSANIATWFWIAARLTQSMFLLVFVASQNKETVNNRRKPFLFSLIYVAFVSAILMIFHDMLPVLVDENGTTTLKKGLELFIITIIGLTIFRLYTHYKKERTSPTLDIILALVFLFNSELIFSSYTHVYDSINMLGHLYKIIGYVYFMKGIYVANIKTPFEALFETRTALRKSENQIQAITDSLGEGIFVLDKNRKLVFINPEGERLLGYKKEELVGKEIHNMIHFHSSNGGKMILDAEDCPIHRCLKVKTTVRTDDDIFIRKDGNKMPVSYTATPLMEKGEIIGSVVAFQNIEKQKQYVKQIKQQAYYDMLTSLPNRRYFLEKLTEEINQAKVTDQIAVLYLDLDNFKNINDSFGHVIGDQLLKKIGNRLKSVHRDLFVSHNSGDEFALFMKGDKQKVDAVAKQIIDVINHPFSIDRLEIFTTASIGISMFPYDGIDGTKLLQVSDIALFEAKKKGKNRYIFYNDELEQRRIRNAWIEQHLYSAISNGEISVHYQPIVDLRSKKIFGLEALARWKHPKSGFIPPSEFIQIAENNGLIIPIGAQVMETAARDLKRLHEEGFQHLYISINLSLRQLKHNDFIKKIISLPEKYKLKPEHFQFEITETVALFEDSDLIRTIQQLRELGFRIAIDDFGKGFSSIGYLKQITVDTIKIDKSYVNDLCKNKEIAKLTNAIIAMASFLQLKIIAEGVELTEHVSFLNKYQNVLGQGYYFSRPIPFDQMTTYLQKHSKIS